VVFFATFLGAMLSAIAIWKYGLIVPSQKKHCSQECLFENNMCCILCL
jgi:hypothetical protein